MINEEKKENKFDTKVVYDEKGDFEVMTNEKTDNKTSSTTPVDTPKAKKTLGEKLGKAAETKPTTPLEELDLKNPSYKESTKKADTPATNLNLSSLKDAVKKPEPPKADSKEPLKADSKEAPKPEPPKVDSKEPLKPEATKDGSLSKMNLGTKPAGTSNTTTEVPKTEVPKEEPKKETISPFELQSLEELCRKLNYSVIEVVETFRRNLTLLTMNAVDRFYAESSKALIIHGLRLLDENGSVVMHIETESAGHAIIKLTSNSYQDCPGEITTSNIIMAQVNERTIALCSMNSLPKLRFMK